MLPGNRHRQVRLCLCTNAYLVLSTIITGRRRSVERDTVIITINLWMACLYLWPYVCIFFLNLLLSSGQMVLWKHNTVIGKRTSAFYGRASCLGQTTGPWTRFIGKSSKSIWNPTSGPRPGKCWNISKNSIRPGKRSRKICFAPYRHYTRVSDVIIMLSFVCKTIRLLKTRRCCVTDTLI